MRLTREQEDLRAAVRGLLDRYPPGPAPDADAEHRLWQRLSAEIGVAGLAIPERFGGAGAGPVEVHIVMEELGRSLTPAPMLGSAVLATQALLRSGDEAACRTTAASPRRRQPDSGTGLDNCGGPVRPGRDGLPGRSGVCWYRADRRLRRRRRGNGGLCLRHDRGSTLRAGWRPRLDAARSRIDAGRGDRPVRGATSPAGGDARREHQR